MNRTNIKKDNQKEIDNEENNENVQTRFYDKTSGVSFLSNFKVLNTLIQFLNIREQIQFMLVNNQLKNIIGNSSIYKKYIQLRKEFCQIEEKKNYNLRKKQKKKPQVKSGLSYYILRNYDDKEKNKVYTKVEKIPYPIDFEKIDIDDLISENGEKITNIAKKYNLSSYEKYSIFSGLLEEKLNNIYQNDNDEQNDKNKHLQYNNNIKDSLFFISSGLTHLNNKFNSIDLSGNEFELNHIKIVSLIISSNSQNLERINLHNNLIDDISVKYLFQSLENCNNLKFLDLSMNKISNKGLDYAEDFFSNNKSIIFLNISNNLLGTEGISYFLHLIENNTNLINLDISYNGIEKNGIESLCDYLKSNTNLKHLLIGGNYICDDGLKILINFLINNETKIERLSLENNNITSEVANDISDLISKKPNLISLNLKSNDLEEKGVEIILKNQDFNLTSINISNNNITSIEKILNLINNNTSLNHLFIDCCNLKKESLKISSNNLNVSPVGLIKNILLNENSNLISLSLHQCKINDNINLIFEGLTNNQKIDIINLSRNNLGYYKKQFQSIISCLNTNKTLKSINLDSNHLDNDCLTMILDGLKDNDTLKAISLNNNDFTIDGINNFVSKIQDKQFYKCEFYNCGLSDDDLKRINKIFYENRPQQFYIEEMEYENQQSENLKEDN